MSQIFRRIAPLLLPVIIVSAACGGKNSGQTSTPTAPAPTPAAPAPPPPESPPAPAPPSPPVICGYTVSAEPDDYDRDGGNGALKITTQPGCKWSVKTDATWASIEGAAAGNSSATLKVFVQPNEDAPDRRMTFTVEDQRASLSQPGQGDCSYSVSPVQAYFPRDRWSGEIAIETMRGCRWTATSDASWLLPRTAAGSGSARLAYAADLNPDNGRSARVGTIQIRWRAPTAGQNVRVVQSPSCHIAGTPATGGLPSGATFSGFGGPSTLTIGPEGGAVHLWILSEPFIGCVWSMESSDTWLTWEFPRPHQLWSGDGDLHFTVPSNASTNSRTAMAVLGGWQLTVIQRGR